MKRLLTLTIIFLLVTQHLFPQSQSDRQECLKSNLIKLESISPDNEDYTDLEALKGILKDVEIVMLGEQSHGDGTTFETKVRLIKFLHQELGFDVVAFESGFYDCYKAWQLIKNGENADTSAKKGVFGIWSWSEQVQPLFEYIEREKDKKRPLILAGFDIQFTASASSTYLVSELNAFLDSLDLKINKTKEWATFTASLQKLIEIPVKHDKEDTKLILKYLDLLDNELSSLKQNRETLFWRQLIKSTKINVIVNFKNRDKQMADNLIWLKEHYYPNKKIICWGATSHFSFNSSQVKFRGIFDFGINKYYNKEYFMGGHVKREFGNRLYSIGFTAYDGNFGSAWSKAQEIKEAKPKSLEYAINETGVENCLIDFRQMGNECFLKNSKVLSRPMGYGYMKANISQIMDGIIFNKTMTKSELIEKKK